MTYQMTTISGGTRIRQEPNTAASVLTSVNANVTVKGDELFTAPVALSNSSGVYQNIGDKWLKVTYNGVTGWMAYIHKGQAICKDFQEIGVVPDPEPTPVTFPQSFTLIADNGAKAEYGFIRVIE